MNAVDFVARLEKVRQTGAARWTACCPAHEDRHPSLSVSEGDDGRVLIKCFAGCSIDDIVKVLGLNLPDIMPDKPFGHHFRAIRKPFPAADVLENLSTEAMIVWLAGCAMANGKALTPAEKSRLDLACSRIERAIHG